MKGRGKWSGSCCFSFLVVVEGRKKWRRDEARHKAEPPPLQAAREHQVLRKQEGETADGRRFLEK